MYRKEEEWKLKKKTDYFCKCERDRWKCEEVKVDEFKYLWLRL